MKPLFAISAVLVAATLLAAPKPVPVPSAQSPAADDGAPWPETQIEIFKLAPGKQEAFFRDIARADEVSAAGGQPPIQLFVHQDGADWDVLLYKPIHASDPTPAQRAAMDAKAKELQMETGPAFFVRIRQMIASHTDTRTYGPITAAKWVARLEAWRAAHPGAAQEK
jgi:hypothetical protein